MKLMKNGVVLDSKKNKNKSDNRIASDELVDKISKQIEEEYAETFKLLSKQSNKNNS